MAIFGSLTGDLALDSPSLKGVIRRSIGTEALARLSEIYAYGFELSGYEEAPVRREIGASYNPRPARICELISKEGFADELLFGAAILSCAVEFSQSPTPFQDEEKVARGAISLLKGPKSDSSREEIVLAEALALDKARHLHMSSISDIERAEFIQEARRVSSLDENGSYLKERLDKAISRF